MTYDRESWPIAAAMLQFPAVHEDGTRIQDAEPEAWRDAFAEIAATGFGYVEIPDSWLRIGDLTPERLGLLAQAARDAGVSVPSATVVRSSIIDPEHAADNLAYTHRAIDAAAELDVWTIGLGLHRPLTGEQNDRLWFWTAPGASDPDDQDTWNAAVDGFRELGSHAADVGLDLSLELYEDTYLGTADSAVRLIEEIDLPTVGLNPDFGNLVRLHRPIEDWRELAAKTLPYANYWHVKNYLRDEDPERGIYVAMPAPLRLGILDYRWLVAEALRSGFRGVFTCEHYGGDGLGVSAANREYLRSLLPAAGSLISVQPSSGGHDGC